MTLEAKKDNLIIYEDFDIIIVNKPAGILSHADKHEKNETISQ